ncbi:MAG: phosphoesterase, partial [Nocardioides sp.]
MCTCPLTRRGLLAGSTGVVTTAAVARFEPAAAGQSRSETFTGTFTGVGTPDWHYLPVEVPRGVREIEVSYAYEKTDTGLGFSANVIDIGIFDPSGHDLGAASGFRGWSGGARDRFRISRRRATPGYLAGPITPGTWHVVLGPFAVVPPGVDYEVTVTLHFGRDRRRFKPEPAPRR